MSYEAGVKASAAVCEARILEVAKQIEHFEATGNDQAAQASRRSVIDLQACLTRIKAL